jgi:exodeoxyribonuclease VII large subunit
MNDRIYSVSEINNLVKQLLDRDAVLNRVYVSGELSNYKIYPSGHHYFTIKDKEASLRCVMFKREASALRFKPENGMMVIAFGRITVFPRDGQYQLYCSGITPDGIGDLHVAFEQLKEKLLAEGLFDRDKKKQIPKYPERIAIVTSAAGAAIRDMIRVLGKRFPAAKIIILPVRVQGAEAPPEISGAIKYANKYKIADLIITGRGGGSIEDLWAFNDERVARAIFESEIPVISAVGHEPDVTISDFVADLRAATPSNAAELAVPDKTELIEYIKTAQARMLRALGSRTESLREKLKHYAENRMLKNPLAYVEDRRVLLDYAQEKLAASAANIVIRKKAGFLKAAASLDAMSPLKVLARGYSIAQKADGSLLKKASEAAPGDRLKIILSEGAVACTVSDD